MDKAKGGRIEGGRLKWGEWWGENGDYCTGTTIKIINKKNAEGT